MKILTHLFTAKTVRMRTPVSGAATFFTEDSSPRVLLFKRSLSQFRLLDLERFPVAGTGAKSLLCQPGNTQLPHCIYLLDKSGTSRSNSRSGLLTMISSRAYRV